MSRKSLEEIFGKQQPTRPSLDEIFNRAIPEPKEPTFGESIKSAFQERVGRATEAQQKSVEGQQTLGSGTLQTLGQGAGFVGDVLFEGIKAITPQFVERGVEKGVQAVAQTVPVQQVSQKYSDWVQKHPEASANLEATLNLGSLIPAGKATEIGTRAVATATPKVVATTADVASQAGKLAGRGVSEASGTLTGLNRGGELALRQSLEKGGESAELARKAMRGTITPEETQQVARDATTKIIAEKNAKYVNDLTKLKESNKSYDISPIINKLDSELEAFQVRKTPEGGLDFSSSPLRFNSEARKDIETIYSEMKDFGLKEGDRTVVGLDSLKRAFSDLYSPSGEARKFVASMSGEVKKVLNEIPGYKEMSENYGNSTKLIQDIQKNLSLGTRTGTDTAYRKLSQVLRNDTDARKMLLQELDNASGGKLIPMLSGTMASPILPRGLTRQLTGLFAGGAGIEGGSILAALKAMVVGGAVTSPRLAGEIINLLNVPRKATKPFREAIQRFIEKESLVKPTIEGAKSLKKTIKETPNKQGGFINLDELSNKRNDSGIKDSVDRYRAGGRFKQWTDFTPDEWGPSSDLQSLSQAKEVVKFYKEGGSGGIGLNKEYKIVKNKEDGTYTIFASE